MKKQAEVSSDPSRPEAIHQDLEEKKNYGIDRSFQVRHVRKETDPGFLA